MVKHNTVVFHRVADDTDDAVQRLVWQVFVLAAGRNVFGRRRRFVARCILNPR